MEMNWTRVVKYTLALWGATFAVAFVFGAIEGVIEGVIKEGVIESAGNRLLLWLRIAKLIATLGASTAVFARLAYVQLQRPIGHALLVLLISSLSALPINVFLFGQQFIHWALSSVFGAITMATGVCLGAALRSRNVRHRATE
jgi:hypothetical protein